MEFLYEFLDRYAVPEIKNIIVDLDVCFEQQGYVEHVEEVSKLIEVEGEKPSQDIVDDIVKLYRKHSRTLLTKLYIIVDTETTLYEYKLILETLNLIEFSVESKLLIEEVIDEITPQEQLTHWVNLLVSEYAYLFEERIFDVKETLINSIIEIHELKVPVEPVELDPKVKERIQFFSKVNSKLNNKEVLAFSYIRKIGFKSFLSKEQIFGIFSTDIRDLITKPEECAFQIYFLALLTEVELNEVNNTVNKWINELFNNPVEAMRITDAFSKTQDVYKSLC